MSNVLARGALQAKLATITPELATSYDNIEYKPVNGVPYQKAHFMPATPENPTMGDDYHRIIGIFQVSLFYPINKGTADSGARAELIKTTFKRGTSMTNGSVTVIVNKTPAISPGRRDGDRWHIPVKISWYAGIY